MDKEPHDTACSIGPVHMIKGNCPLIQSITKPANLYQEFRTKSRKVSFLESQRHHKLLGTHYHPHLLLELKED